MAHWNEVSSAVEIGQIDHLLELPFGAVVVKSPFQTARLPNWAESLLELF